MKLTAIKVGRWYETKFGVGKCTKSGGTFPPSCMMDIIHPFPRGVVNLTPKDVLREVTPLVAPTDKLNAKSACRCSHTGDVSLGQENDSDHAGLQGHGHCTKCDCEKFTWAAFRTAV